MALYSPKMGTDSHPSNPNIKPQEYKAISVDTQHVDLRQLITHVEGMKWILHAYYSQYVTPDSELASQEVTRLDEYQQYLRIHDLEVRVTSPLSQSQDQQSKEFTYTGTATVFPGMIPKVGDMFIADIGDGRAGIFTLTATNRLTILQDSTYSIEYELVSFEDANRIADLNEKTVKSVTFVKDFININRKPYLVDSELETLKKLRQHIATIPEMYFDLFYSQEFSTLLVPDQEKTMYDPHVVTFFTSVVDRIEIHPRLQSIKRLNCDTDRSRRHRTIFDALLELDENILDTASLKSQRYFARSVQTQGTLGGIRYSGIEEVYYPAEDAGRIGNPVMSPLTPSKLRTFNRPIPLKQWLIRNTLLNAQSTELLAPPMHPVTADDWYVLSEHFYKRDIENFSVLEVMVQQRLEGGTPDVKQLLELTDAAETWGRLEQFYYYPILQYLLIYAIGDIN